MGAKPPGTPAVVSINLRKVVEVQKQLADETLFPYYGTTVAGEDFNALVQAVKQAALPDGDLSVFIQTCSNLAGRPLTKALGQDLAWRVAGNLHTLKGSAKEEPRPANVWTGQTTREWSCVEVVDVKFKNLRFKPKNELQKAKAIGGLVHKRGYELKLQFLTGPPAGRIETQFWADSQCDMFKWEFGFDKYNRGRYSTNFIANAHTFLSPLEFLGMHLLVLLDPGACNQDKVAFKEVHGSSSAISFNRAIMARRNRVDFKCPRNYPTTFDCYKCPAGTDTCPAACRLKTLQQRHCTGCNRDHAWFDPDRPEFCTACLAKI